MILSLFDAMRHRLRRARWTRERCNGVRAEDLAMRYLQRQKFKVVARNFKPRTGHGEIDIIAWDSEKLVFVEVKSAESEASGTPDRAIDRHKRESLERAARSYCSRAQVPWENIRFDIVTVVGTKNARLEHYPGAW